MLRLKPAVLADREKIYQWYVEVSQSSSYSYEQFCIDFPDFYFNPNYRMAAGVMLVVDGELEYGCVSYAAYYLEPNAAELCIWLKEPSVCNNTIGSQALALCMQYLSACNEIQGFMMRPSIDNAAAIALCVKLGFKFQTPDSLSLGYIHPRFLDSFQLPFLGQKEAAILLYTP